MLPVPTIEVVGKVWELFVYKIINFGLSCLMAVHLTFHLIFMEVLRCVSSQQGRRLKKTFAKLKLVNVGIETQRQVVS